MTLMFRVKYAIRSNQKKQLKVLHLCQCLLYKELTCFCCVKLSPSNSLLNQSGSHHSTVPKRLAPLSSALPVSSSLLLAVVA
jgi:hypothetical protein